MEETGYLQNMTEAEREVLDKFSVYVKGKENVPKEIVNTWYLLRFCRARKFDIKKIIIMFDNYIQWKTENGLLNSGEVDMVRYKDVKVHYCHGYYNTDKLGRPIYIEKVNELNPKEMFKNYTDDELFKYYIQSYDRLIHLIFPVCSKIANRRIEKSVTIMDLKGVSIMSLFFGKIKTFTKIAAKIAQDYYPEILGKMFIVNSGFMFRGIWGVVSMWIDKKTQNKIKIISGSGKKELLKDIDADKLPEFLGGTCPIGLREEPGPWKEEILKSYQRKSVHVEDQSLVLKYYRTPEEIKAWEDEQNKAKQSPADSAM